MKKVITGIIAFAAGIILILIVGALVVNCNKSHKSSEEDVLHSAITKWGKSNQIDILSTYDFKVYKTITLKDEVEEQLKLHKYRLGWDKSFHKEFSSEAKNIKWSASDRKWYSDRSTAYKDSIAMENTIIDYLESIKELYPDEYEKVSFTTYRLAYTYNDKDNNNTLELCFGTFDSDGNMVKFRPTSHGDWEIIGDTCSIPNYDE